MSDTELREEILKHVNGFGAAPDEIESIGQDLITLAENRRDEREDFLR